MTPAEKLIDSVVKPIEGAKPNDDGLPYATHEGVLDVDGIKLKCYILNNGQRVIDSDDVYSFLNSMVRSPF